jgi:hypothetical protein
MGGYLSAIEQEIDLRAKLADKTFGSLGSANRQPLETLYLGVGGQPETIANAVDERGETVGW